MPDFVSNLKTLRAALGQSGHLYEGSTNIKSLIFFGGIKELIQVSVTDNNIGDRLFVEVLAREEFVYSNPGILTSLDRLRGVAEEFFAERWNDPDPVIHGFRVCFQVQITWKEGAKPGAERLSFERLLRRIRTE